MSRKYLPSGRGKRWLSTLAAIVLLGLAALVTAWLEPPPVELSGRAIASDGIRCGSGAPASGCSA